MEEDLSNNSFFHLLDCRILHFLKKFLSFFLFVVNPGVYTNFPVTLLPIFILCSDLGFQKSDFSMLRRSHYLVSQICMWKLFSFSFLLFC
jgi:hypothetical protein